MAILREFKDGCKRDRLTQEVDKLLSEIDKAFFMHRAEKVLKSTPPKPNAQDYCMLSDVEKESAKCVFPMVLCMAGSKNCKIVNSWGDVFDKLKDYISTHQDALDKIKAYLDWIERYRDRMKKYKGKEYLDKDPRVKKWLLGVSRGRDNRDRLHMKRERERPGLLPRRIAQLSRMVGLRACVIVVSKKRTDRPSAFKPRNLLAKARKILPSLRYWLRLDM